jgi:cytochrome c-type biogenesis protein
MTNDLLMNTSLIIAFFGGMVMLFAPCCITLMLPAYLGTVFKSRSKIVLMTAIFAAGVASIILPIVLGARFLTSFFSSYHNYVFATGSLIMIVIGIMTLMGKKISLPFVNKLQAPKVTDAASAYVLGVISGISSACCAPVLLGALTLAAISPSLLQAGAIGLAYTFGIVFPLFVMGLLYKKRLWRASRKLQEKKVTIAKYTTSLANFLSFLLFTGAGLFFLIMAITSGDEVNSSSSELAVRIKYWVDMLTEPIRAIPFSNVLFGLLLIGLLVYLVRLARREMHDEEDEEK